jgi:pimeloyl-ACP methyl ester carboxylesterase
VGQPDQRAYAVRHPERVSRMVFYGGFAHNFRTAQEIDAIATLFAQSWGKANPAARLFRACHAIDVRELAKQVAVPTLVMHSRNEPGVPVECGREIASLIPGARFVPLDSQNHLVLEREPAYRQFIDETVAFVRGG